MRDPDEAFETIYQKYYQKVCRTLQLMGVPSERSLDLAQETFLRIYRASSQQHDLGWRYVETVARRVAINDARWHHAAKRSAQTVPVEEFSEEIAGWADPAADLPRKEATERLEAAIDTIPGEAADTLRLSLAGLTHLEMSRVMNVSRTTIGSRIREARRLLQQRVEASGPYYGNAAALAINGPSRGIDEIIESPVLSEPSLIFAPPPASLAVSKLIVSVEDALIEAISREPESIFKIPSRAFEQLLYAIFKSKGFETELTKATRDGGRDIIAVHEVLGIRSKYIVECKRYAEHRKVALQLVQRLYGVKVAEGANKAILATTSSFTRDAVAFASHHIWDLELKAYDDVMAWIREYTSRRTSAN